MTDEFDEYVASVGSKATLTTIVVPDAIDRLRAGDADTHNRLVSEYAPRLAGCDAIMLAHFSTSPRRAPPPPSAPPSLPPSSPRRKRP